MVSDQEKAIGARLRAFRESLQVPRARFAVAIGFGSERLASIESGRAPLRYEVFKAISNRYHINPKWLLSGFGSMTTRALEPENPAAPSRSLFSKVYTERLASTAPPDPRLHNLMGRAVRAMDGLLILEQRGKIPHSIIDGYMNFFDQVSGCFDEGGDATPAVLSGFRSTLRNLDVETRKVLTHASSVLNLIPVKPKERTLKELLRDLNRLTEQPGKKSELAEFLKAPLESVSRWLSGSREPGGQTVLKMDYWVNLQERKQ